jgi:hypothetical protein
VKQLTQQHEHQVVKILRLIDRRYPRELDAGLDAILKSAPWQSSSSSSSSSSSDSKMDVESAVNDANKSRLLQLINSVFDQSGHQLLAESGTTLFFSLEHPSAHVRGAALDKLSVFLSEEKLESSTATSILEQRLAETQPKVGLIHVCINSMKLFP